MNTETVRLNVTLPKGLVKLIGELGITEIKAIEKALKIHIGL